MYRCDLLIGPGRNFALEWRNSLRQFQRLGSCLGSRQRLSSCLGEFCLRTPGRSRTQAPKGCRWQGLYRRGTRSLDQKGENDACCQGSSFRSQGSSSFRSQGSSVTRQGSSFRSRGFSWTDKGQGDAEQSSKNRRGEGVVPRQCLACVGFVQ